MKSCVQYIHVREQINQHSFVLSNVSQTILANIKIYLAVLYVFCIDALNSLTPLMNQLLPMSLVRRQQLHEILTMVLIHQNGLQDRLSLAVSIQDFHPYNEANLATPVEANESGLNLTLARPMASKAQL